MNRPCFTGITKRPAQSLNPRIETETALRSRRLRCGGLARTEYADGRPGTALTPLQKIVTEFPDSAFIPYANFLLGKSKLRIATLPGSVRKLYVYLELRPGVLDAYVQELRGDALFDNGNFAEALEAYNAAMAAPQIDDTLLLEIKIAQTRIEIGDFAAAISTYETIFTRTSNDYIKAQMDYLAGLAHQEVDQTDLAHEKFLHAVENYPLSYYSYLALLELVGAEVPVSELNRGLVDYFAGQYDVALAAFDRHIDAGFDTDGTARYYRALTQQELQNYESAIQGLIRLHRQLSRSSQVGARPGATKPTRSGFIQGIT